MKKQNDISVVEQLFNLYDSVSQCARELGLERSQIQAWRRNGYIPYKRGNFIEAKTNGKIKAIDVYVEAGRLCK